MKVVIVGASGNIGSAFVRELASSDHADHEIVGVARRIPEVTPRAQHLASVRWESAQTLRRVIWTPSWPVQDVLVHLAWLFQPTHDPDLTWQANAVGTRRVLEAAARQGVSAVIVNSSIAASPPATDRRSTRAGQPTGRPARHTRARRPISNRLLGHLRARAPRVQVVRIRPAVRSSSDQLPRPSADCLPAPSCRAGSSIPSSIPMLPVPRGLHMQTVHSARSTPARWPRAVDDQSAVPSTSPLTTCSIATPWRTSSRPKALDVPAGFVRHALGVDVADCT